MSSTSSKTNEQQFFLRSRSSSKSSQSARHSQVIAISPTDVLSLESLTSIDNIISGVERRRSLRSNQG